MIGGGEEGEGDGEGVKKGGAGGVGQPYQGSQSSEKRIRR